VQDRFIDDLFHRFQSGALAELLAWCSGDALNSDMGDSMEDLFIPALENAADDTIENSILETFNRYYQENNEYYSGNYWQDLTSRIVKNASPETGTRLKKILHREARKKEIETDLLSKDPEIITNRILELGNEINVDEWKQVRMKFLSVMDQTDLSFCAREKYLHFLIKQRDNSYLPGTLCIGLLRENKEKLFAGLESFVIEKNDKDIKKENKKQLIKTLRDAIQQSYNKNDETTLLKSQKKGGVTNLRDSLRAFTDILEGVDPKKSYQAELTIIFQTALKETYSTSDLFAAFELIKESPDPIHIDDFEGASDLEREIAELIKKEAYETMAKLIRCFPLLTMRSSVAEGLAMNSVIAMRFYDDSEALNLLHGMLPENLTNDTLAYNLACLYAFRGDEEKMFRYIRSAVELGKAKEQFLDDDDFSSFAKDEDFLQIIA